MFTTCLNVCIQEQVRECKLQLNWNLYTNVDKACSLNPMRELRSGHVKLSKGDSTVKFVVVIST